MDKTRFFANTPIFAMLHLAGDTPVERALEELTILEGEGVDGAIVENYHTKNLAHVERTLEVIQQRRTKETTLQIGVNVLPNNYANAFGFARRYGASFIQLDYVAGRYEEAPQGISLVNSLMSRTAAKDIVVLGGVWPKYYTPLENSVLEDDLREGMARADGIVVTGEGTGMETPLTKIHMFRQRIGGYPLIVGAGLMPENVREQLLIADGAIVGSCLKRDGNTRNKVDKRLVRAFMDQVRRVRTEKI